MERPSHKNNTRYEFKIPALNDSIPLILDNLTTKELLNLSMTSKEYRNIFNNTNLLNMFRKNFMHLLPSLSFMDGNSFLHDLRILEGCRKIWESKLYKDTNYEYRIGDILTPIFKYMDKETLIYVRKLADKGYVNYKIINIFNKKRVVITPINIFGNIINLVDNLIGIITTRNVGLRRVSVLVAELPAFGVKIKKGTPYQYVLKLIMHKGLSIYMDFYFYSLDQNPSVLMPYLLHRYIGDKKIIITAYCQNKGPVESITYTTDYKMKNISAEHGIEYFEENAPPTIVLNPVDTYSNQLQLTKKKNLVDGTELWEDENKLNYILTLGNYAIIARNIINNYNNNIVALKTYLDRNIDFSFASNQYIIIAAGKGHIDIINLIINDARINPAVSNNAPLIAAAKNNHIEVIKSLLENHKVDMNLSANILDNEIIRRILSINIRDSLKSLFIAYVQNNSQNNIQDYQKNFLKLIASDGFYYKLLRHIIRTRETLIKRIETMKYIISSNKYLSSRKAVYYATISVLEPNKFNSKLLNEFTKEQINVYFSVKGFLLLSTHSYSEILDILKNEGANINNINSFLYLYVSHYGYLTYLKQELILFSGNNLKLYEDTVMVEFGMSYIKTDILEILIK
jgi:hypothetical protein